jgi:hypothetical protein
MRCQTLRKKSHDVIELRLATRDQRQPGKATTMNVAVEKFLEEYPTTVRWLNEIIDLSVDYQRGAHVRIIARELSKSHPHVERVEETVTRTINNYCGDARDFKRPPKYNLFERVEPATYRLRTYPQKPNLIELVGIEFEDATMQNVWTWFADAARKKRGGLSDEQTLTLFVNYMNSDSGKEMYAEQKKIDDQLRGQL